jgi:sigma-B regulation protein RsbU (phosphoserine phosphatase)
MGSRFVGSETGLPLGVRHGSFSETSVPLLENARLMLYSDGITEAENPDSEEFGAARLREHIAQPDASMESLLGEVRKFANGGGLRDDATVILLRSHSAAAQA